MKKWTPKSEVELARPVVEWLEQEGWDVFQEVKLDDMRADIVALEQPNLSVRRAWVIECKRTPSLELFSQAWRWRKYAHWSSVVLPDGPKYWTDVRKYILRMITHDQTGLIPVGDAGVVAELVVRREANNDADSYDLIQACTPAHKTAAPAGSQGGGYVTPFSQTLKRLEAFVAEHPGVELKMAAKLVEHHYGGRDPAWTFRVNIEKLIKKGVIKTLRAEEKAGLLCLFSVHQGPAVVASGPAVGGAANAAEGRTDGGSAADSVRD